MLPARPDPAPSCGRQGGRAAAQKRREPDGFHRPRDRHVPALLTAGASPGLGREDAHAPEGERAHAQARPPTHAHIRSTQLAPPLAQLTSAPPRTRDRKRACRAPPRGGLALQAEALRAGSRLAWVHSAPPQPRGLSNPVLLGFSPQPCPQELGPQDAGGLDTWMRSWQRCTLFFARLPARFSLLWQAKLAGLRGSAFSRIFSFSAF